ncbi:MAG: hypothetical protein OEQ12_04970 [Nitrosopumilus sp.]|nr:hypothetical protein [Nitrosopumilus sp.]
MMKVSSMGIRNSDKKLLFKPLKLSEFRKKIADGLQNNTQEFDDISKVAKGQPAFRGIGQVHAPRLDSSAESGWTFLINPNDEMANEIKNTIKPLAKLRGMADNDQPLFFDSVPKDDWIFWLDDVYHEYRSCSKKHPPKYIFIIGSPDQIPLRFQSLLSLQSYVGRLDFTHKAEKQEKILQLKTYVEKLVKLENNNPVEKETIFFATDHGIGEDGCYDPTHYNHLYLETPLVSDVKSMQNFHVTEITSTQANPNQATKTSLLSNIENSKPALVFTASKSINASGENIDTQNEITGSIVCEGNQEGPLDDYLITADSISYEKPFCDGGIFFQYSDCSYGIPSSSYLSSYIRDTNALGIPEPLADRDFISAIPKRLLFHPNGPIAFIGHVDLELMLSYTNNEQPMPEGDRSSRLAPFSSCIDSLLKGRPVGFSLDSMIKNYGTLTALLATMHQQYIQRNFQNEEEFLDKLLDTFIRSTEAGNYMVFGDPAANLS